MKKLLIPEKDGKRLIIIKNIVYCEAEGKYSRIVIDGCGEKIICKCLRELESILSYENFCRTHRKYLINLYFFEKIYTNGTCFVELKNNLQIPVSFRRKKQVINCIDNFFGV